VNFIELIDLYIGGVAGLFYFSYGLFFVKKVPTLTQVVIVILSWAGAVMGIKLGIIAFTATDTDLGLMKSQRIIIAIGALAVIWTAGQSFISEVKSLSLTKQSS